MRRFRRDDQALTPSWFATDGTSYVDRDDIDHLKQAVTPESRPARYCLHPATSSALHSMVIRQPFGTYAQPRKHQTKAKLLQIVDGEMVVAIFDDDGAISAAHHLAADKVLVVHVEPDRYHTNMALTPQAIYHEVIAGPFERASGDRVFAAFAPPDNEQERGLAYVREAVASIRPDIVLD